MLQLDLGFWKKGLARFESRQASEPRLQTNVPFLWRHGITVRVIRQPRARRYLLRMRARNEARLVVPRGGSQREALRFLEQSEAWLLDQVRTWKGRVSEPWREGTRFLFRGEEVLLRVESDKDGRRLAFADQKILFSGEMDDFRPLVWQHLRKLAERELSERTWELACVHGIAIQRVTVRGQKTRWGSCSVRGTISLNWRLIQAPPFVGDYLIIHELMHRREMNHSGRFWKHVAKACPDFQQAEAWLKKNRLGGEWE